MSEKEAPTTETPQPKKPVTKAPKPIEPVGNSYRPPDAKRNHTLTSWPPSFPNELRSQATMVISKALKKFPFQGMDAWYVGRQPETLQFCKCVVSDMTPLLKAAVQSNTLRRDSVLSVMSEILHYLRVASCDNGSERFRLEQETNESDEWEKLADALVEVETVKEFTRAAPEQSSTEPAAKPEQRTVGAKPEGQPTRKAHVRDDAAPEELKQEIARLWRTNPAWSNMDMCRRLDALAECNPKLEPLQSWKDKAEGERLWSVLVDHDRAKKDVRPFLSKLKKKAFETATS